MVTPLQNSKHNSHKVRLIKGRQIQLKGKFAIFDRNRSWARRRYEICVWFLRNV